MKRRMTVQIFRGADNQCRVRIVASNGKKICVTEGYSRPSVARRIGGKLADAIGARFQDLIAAK